MLQLSCIYIGPQRKRSQILEKIAFIENSRNLLQTKTINNYVMTHDNY